MNGRKESMIVRQIRSLLDQLEADQSMSTNEPECLDESLAEKLLQLSCDRYWIYDPSTNIIDIYMTRSGEDYHAKVTRSLSTLLSTVDADNRKKVASVFERILSRKSEQETYEYFETKDDLSVGYEVCACPCEQTGHLKIVGVSHIISKTQQTVEQIMQAQKKYELLMGLSSMYIWEYDVKKKRFYGNRSLCEKLHLEEKRYSLEELESFIRIEEIDAFMQLLDKKELQEKALVHIKAINNNFEYIFETDFKPILNQYGDYVMMMGTMNDITEHEMLKTLASKDALTGCYNRNMADVTLESCFKSFQEHGDFYTIIFFDVDKFKSVNDRYGHDMGDYVLASICDKIGKEIRNNDMMFRWGGDEFLLICKGIAKENIYGYIDRLRKNIEFSTFEFNKSKLRLTISIGAAIFYKTDRDYNAAMKRADRSLYKAKLAGRNKVAILK